jgi:predicted O-methyltransferase YrrM
MKRLLRRVLHYGLQLYNRIFNRRFTDIARDTRGMLNPLVYRRLYQLAYRLPDLPIVEIGGASGSASIALALGMKESGKRSKLIVVEKMEGGSRTAIGGYNENLEHVLGNFRRYGVEDTIGLYPHELTMKNGHEVVALAGEKIAAFMHDADGRLDRDFALFWPILMEGGAIVIDDYGNRPNFQPISPAHPQGGTKHVMTYRLLNQIMAWGLFARDWQFRDTVFGHKPSNADFTRFDLQACVRIAEQVERDRAAAVSRKAAAVTAHP